MVLGVFCWFCLWFGFYVFCFFGFSIGSGCMDFVEVCLKVVVFVGKSVLLIERVVVVVFSWRFFV